jgi:hypothetical protein
VVAAAAIGLLLGVASVATTLDRGGARGASQPVEPQPLAAPPASPEAPPIPQVSAARLKSAPAASVTPASPSAVSAAASAQVSPAPARRKSIF